MISVQIRIFPYSDQKKLRVWRLFTQLKIRILIIQNNIKDILTDVKDIDFANICDWFVDNQLSFDFGEGQNKFVILIQNVGSILKKAM